MSENVKKSNTNKIKISSREWVMAGIKDGSIIISEDALILNLSAFSANSSSLTKRAQANSYDAMQRSIGYGVPGGVVSGMKGKGLGSILSGTTTVPRYTTSRLGDMLIGPSGVASPTGQAIEAVQGVPTSTGGVVSRADPTAGVRMGLKQPLSAVGTEFSAARATGSGRAVSTVRGLAAGGRAVPGALATARTGLAGAVASGGVRGFMAGNLVSAAGSMAAWGVHKGLMSVYDWSRGANDISGAIRTPKGAQEFNKAQEILAQKVMPMMYGHAAGPNEKLDALNSYIASMAKDLENDPGYQAAVSGKIQDVMSEQTLPEDLSSPSSVSEQFNPANQ